MAVQSKLLSSPSSPIVVDYPEPMYTPTLNCHDYIFSGQLPKTTEKLLEAGHQRIEELEAALEKQAMYVQLKVKPDSSIRFYTGFPSFDVLVATFRALSPTAQNMFSWSQMQHLRNKGIRDVEGLRQTMEACKLSLFDQFYSVPQKLRVGTLNQVLAGNFNISQTTVSITCDQAIFFWWGGRNMPDTIVCQFVCRPLIKGSVNGNVGHFKA